MHIKRLTAIVILFFTPLTHSQNWPASWTTAIEPFHIIGPVFYVGSQELSSYLIVDGTCLMLVNVGMPENAEMVLSSIKKLGFNANNIQYILITQAHLDHAGGVSTINEKIHAKILVGNQDLPLIKHGGHNDYVFANKLSYPKVDNATGIKNGETLGCNNTQLTTVSTPGHTPGSTSWLLTLDNEQKTTVLFQSSISIIDQHRLRNNPLYPDAIQDYRNTFKKLEHIHADYILPDHLQFARPTENNSQPQRQWFKNRHILAKQIETSRKKLNSTKTPIN